MPDAALWAAAVLLAPAIAGADDAAAPEPEAADIVVVSGSRTEARLRSAPVAVEVIDRRSIEATGAHDVAELLESHSGIQVSRSFRGAGLSMQGMSSQQVLVLVDGERIPGVVDGVLDLSRLSTEEVERVEVVKGASSSLYGSDAMGGVINIITRGARKPYEGSLRAQYGRLSSGELAVGLGARRKTWNLRFSGGYRHRDSFDLDRALPDTTGSAFDRAELVGRGEWRPNRRQRYRARAEYRYSDRAGVDANDAGARFDRLNRTEQVAASLATEQRLLQHSKLRVTGSYQLYRDQSVSDQIGADALDRDETNRQHLGQLSLQFDHPFVVGHQLSVGFDGIADAFESPRLDDGGGQRYRGAVFAQHEWIIFEEPYLVVVPSVRFDLDSQFGFAPSPRLALRYDPMAWLTLRASYGLGFRAPSFTELLLRFENPSVGYEVSGNPDLGPERSRGANLGITVRPHETLSVELSGFRNDIDDLIDPQQQQTGGAAGRDLFLYVNVKRAYTQGAELQLSWRPLPALRLGLGYTYTDAVDASLDRPLQGRARHRGVFEARYVDRGIGVKAMLRARVESRRPFYDAGIGDEERLFYSDVSGIVDARLSWAAHDALSIFLGVENLTDAGDHRTLPLPPSTAYGGIEARL